MHMLYNGTQKCQFGKPLTRRTEGERGGKGGGGERKLVESMLYTDMMSVTTPQCGSSLHFLFYIIFWNAVEEVFLKEISITW